MKYRKKPIVVEAVQWTGENVREIHYFAKKALTWGGNPGNEYIVIPTLEGDMMAMPGDWIIRGIKGELYPCKPDIFAATYEPVE